MNDPIFGEIISTYSRTEALADGVLVDVSATAREAGIKFPVALTRAVWTRYVEIPAGVRCQDEAGRLWDILWMFRVSVRRAALAGGEPLLYHLYVRQHNRERLDRRDLVTLKALCGPGDDAEPVLTILLPEED